MSLALTILNLPGLWFGRLASRLRTCLSGMSHHLVCGTVLWLLQPLVPASGSGMWLERNLLL